MPTRPDRLFLLDGMALAYRAYFALISRPLVNSKGENTSAIYGFVNALLKILTEERPEYLAVVFDAKGPTFRHERFSDYKATRQKMPEEMAGQMEKLKETVRAFNVPLLEVPGCEADDVIGTLARRAEGELVHTFMVTGDKDFMQLISPLISMYKPGKSGGEPEIIDASSVREKFGVPPEQVIDVLGLMGDSSDNVPGVPGIGPKTAIPLVQKHGGIPQIYEHLEEIPQKGVREKLRKNRESALLSRELVTIKTDVPLEIDFHELRTTPPDTDMLVRLFQDLEFRTLITRLRTNPLLFAPSSPEAAPEPPKTGSADIRTEKHRYRCTKSLDDVAALAARLSQSQSFVIDAEATSANPFEGSLVGVSFCMEPASAWFVPLCAERPFEGTGWADVPYEGTEALALLGPILENPRIGKAGQNIKYDILLLANAGIRLRGVLFDTMVASYALRPDAQHSLDALARELLDYQTMTFDDLTGTGRSRVPITSVPLDRLVDYACEDADLTFRVMQEQQKRLTGSGLEDLCQKVEFPLISVLASMELAGIRLDVRHLETMSASLEERIAALIGDIHDMAGEEFNINSTQQLAEILFNRLGLRKIRKTKTGYSTDANVLEALKHDHPIIEKLLTYRLLTKLKSTYIDALPALVDPRTGRLHTSFNQTVAATGRLASNDPNLQNIPIRTEEGRSIRKAFIPGDDGLLLLSADYSQIELRVMAHICGDPGLTEAFTKGEDIHESTAAKVFGVPPGEVTQDMRRKAKEVNFGIMYGLSPFGLAQRLEISQGEAKEIIANYFRRFPAVKQYILSTIEEARLKGYVQTLLGRRRYLPDINSRNGTVRANAERQAINMPIQGTAADMIKKAMIGVDREMRTSGLHGRMLLQVHDELLFEVPENEVEDTAALVIREMKSALSLDVPLEVDVGSGHNWLEAH